MPDFSQGLCGSKHALLILHCFGVLLSHYRPTTAHPILPRDSTVVADLVVLAALLLGDLVTISSECISIRHA